MKERPYETTEPSLGLKICPFRQHDEFKTRNVLNIGSVLMNAEKMNRSMCLAKCGFFYHLPGEDFLKSFVSKSTTVTPLIEKSLIKRKHENPKKDLTVHVDATFDYNIENFTWASGELIQQKYWAKRFNYVYPVLTTRVIQGCFGPYVAEVRDRIFKT